MKIEYRELIFKRKKKKIIMEKLMLKIEKVLKLISKYRGEEVYQFINMCDMVIAVVEERYLPILIKYIMTRLSSKAVDVMKYRGIQLHGHK